MNEVELRIDKIISLLELKGNKDIVNIKKYTITKLKEDLLFGNSEILKSLRYTIEQIEDKCGRLNIYRYNVIDVKERNNLYHILNKGDKQEFYKKFNEDMYEGYLYFVETTKTKKPLLLIYADKSHNNLYNSEDINNDRFIVLQ